MVQRLDSGSQTCLLGHETLEQPGIMSGPVAPVGGLPQGVLDIS